jgi:hypothetical protein
MWFMTSARADGSQRQTSRRSFRNSSWSFSNSLAGMKKGPHPWTRKVSAPGLGSFGTLAGSGVADVLLVTPCGSIAHDSAAKGPKPSVLS